MIGSLRGLLVAAAITLLLAVILVIDLARTPAPVDRSLVPGFAAARVTELVWTRGTETIDVVAMRSDKATRWEFRTPPQAPADADAVEAVLAALRGARWHRVGAVTPVHASLTIVTGDTRRTLGIGEPLAGTEQVWLVDGDRALLVDGWVARGLDRDRLGLAITAPFAEAGQARSIALTSADPPFELRLAGTPRALIAPVHLQLAPDVAAALDRALAGVTLVRVAAVAARGLRVALDDARLAMEIGGACPGAPELVAIAGTVGQGCIERPVALEAAIARLRGSPGDVVERRAFAADPKHVTLTDGATLELSPPRIAGAPADPARVAELLAALAVPNAPVALPAEKPTAALQVDGVTLDLYASHVLARRGEPIALRPAPGAWAILVRPSRELREPTLWIEEPSTISAIAIDGITYRAGTVLGEWTREPAGPVDARAVQALADALAAPHAIGFAGPVVAVHHVALTIAQPGGKPITHAVAVGAPTAAGCPVQAGADALALAADVCTRVAALAH